MSRRILAAVALLTLLATSPTFAVHPAPVAGSGGAVSSATPAATEAGLAVLRRGGNAVDAAVATALALAVVHPEAGNLGGGGFAVVRVDGTTAALDFRETAPQAARRDMYLDPAGNPIPNASLVGPLATGVPGSPTGLWELHHRFGRLPWRDVVEPARRLAADGFTVTARLHDAIAADRDLLVRFPETAAVWLPDGQAPAAGSRLRLPALAKLLAAYAEHGPAAIVRGDAAAAIERAAKRHGGIVTAADLAAYRPVWRDPVATTAFGWHVASMPLPSSGGIILAQTLGLVERLGWAALPRFGAARAAMLVEIWRRAYADRVLLGDPSRSGASERQLLDGAWLDRRAEEIRDGGHPPSREVRPWPGGRGEHLETTHLSVVDRNGNAVALTTTLNGSFGCGLLVPETGFLLNNEMDDFATAPGRPNLYGLIQGEANAVAPGARMLSSMTPTIAWRDGDVLALGSPGGSHIPTVTAQTLLDVIVDGDDLQAAVDRPRFHHQWLPDVVQAEPEAFAPETAAALTQMGLAIRIVPRLGELCAVRWGTPGGACTAAADPRGPGAAGVVQPARW